MEISRRNIEMALASVFILLLILISLIIINQDKKEAKEPLSAQVINNYNFYGDYNIEYNLIDQTPNLNEREYFYEKKDLSYSDSWTGKTREEVFGNYVKDYYVYILNKERTGRYFTVNFEFENKWGHEYTESITQYVKAGETKKFIYRDVQAEGNEIVDWDYKVIPRN